MVELVENMTLTTESHKNVSLLHLQKSFVVPISDDGMILAGVKTPLSQLPSFGNENIEISSHNVNNISDGLVTTSKVCSIHSCFDPGKRILNPLSFAPKMEWNPQKISLNELKKRYFQKQSGSSRQFDIKVYNALQIVKEFPGAYRYIGALWLTDTYFKVDAGTFAKLLGISDTEGDMFHSNGYFALHSFRFVSKSDMLNMYPGLANIEDVDDEKVMIFTDGLGRFSRSKPYSMTRAS